MARVVLINSLIPGREASFEPMGLACLGAILDMYGHEVGIIDANAYRLNHDQVITALKSFEGEGGFDMVGVSGLITTYRWQRETIKRIKQHYPKVPLIAGGGCASSLKGSMLNWTPELDGICVGEGEKTLIDLVRNQFYFEGVDGTVWRDGNDITYEKPRMLMTEQEMDELPHPAWHLLPMEEVYFPNSPLPVCPEALQARRRISLLTSRGCPFTCTFCTDCGMSGQNRTDYDRSLYPKKIRYHSIDYVTDIIEHVLIRYKVDFVAFLDECFTAKRKRVMEFCDMLESRDLAGSFRYGITGHAKTIDLEMLRRLRDTGCSYIDLGFESANDANLKSIRKHATAKDNQAAFDMCLQTGIYPITNFMCGFPTENIGSMIDTAKFQKRNQIYAQPFLITPYPATKLFEENREKILTQFGGDMERYVESLGQDATEFCVNLTRFDTPTLLGLRDLVTNHRIDLLEAYMEECKTGEEEKEEGEREAA